MMSLPTNAVEPRPASDRVYPEMSGTADLAAQSAIRARLLASPDVLALVPAHAILDRNSFPAPSRSIVIGEAQAIDEGDSIARDRMRVYATLHLWRRELSLAGVKQIAWAVRVAVHARRPVFPDSFRCIDWRVSAMRFLRDPDGETSHGIVTVDALVRVPS